jgi:dolichol-phosphate mannosyltransferase
LNTPKTLIAVPTYNEKENIVALLERLMAFPSELHVLVVDDGSPDGTGDLVEAFSAGSQGRVHLMRRSGKQGLGSAYIAAFRWVERVSPRVRDDAIFADTVRTPTCWKAARIDL